MKCVVQLYFSRERPSLQCFPVDNSGYTFWTAEFEKSHVFWNHPHTKRFPGDVLALQLGCGQDACRFLTDAKMQKRVHDKNGGLAVGQCATCLVCGNACRKAVGSGLF